MILIGTQRWKTSNETNLETSLKSNGFQLLQNLPNFHLVLQTQNLSTEI